MTNVTTRDFDNTRSGCYVDPNWPLTSTHVQKLGVSKVARIQLDDARGAEGQLLGVKGITMRDGQQHDVVYACDMSNTVYAIDAASARLLWKQVLGRPITVTKKYDMWEVSPTWGILSTPVIDVARGILYVVTASSPDGTMAKITYRMHSLSLADGADMAPPLTLDGATFATAAGSPSAKLGDVPRKQRPALTLMSAGADTIVLVAFGSFMESASTNVGIVVAVDVSDAAKPFIGPVWATGGSKYPSAGIWQAGAGLSIDEAGGIHLVTGNGAFDPDNGYVGNSFVRLIYSPKSATEGATLNRVDLWSPYTDASRAGDDPTDVTPATEAPDDMGEMDAARPSNFRLVEAPDTAATSNAHIVGDQDLGSGGALSLPKSLTGYGKDVIVGGGKDGIFYVLDANNLGNTVPGDFAPDKIAGNWAKLLSPPVAATYNGVGVNLTPTELDTIPSAFGGYTRHIHGQPIGYKSPDHGVVVYVQGENGPVKAFQLNPDYTLTWLADGQEIASAGMPPPGGMPGGMLTLTMQHATDNTAVLWSLMPLNGDANKTVTAGRLVAWGANWVDESNGGRTLIKLWDSRDWGWDFRHSKFNRLLPFAGKLWIPSYDGTILVVG